jgi:hypothetical protein
MLALRGLALYWVECPILRILILRLNTNISVWMLRYSQPRFDIKVECQMLFGWSSVELQWYESMIFFVLFLLVWKWFLQPSIKLATCQFGSACQKGSTFHAHFVPSSISMSNRRCWSMGIGASWIPFSTHTTQVPRQIQQWRNKENKQKWKLDQGRGCGRSRGGGTRQDNVPVFSSRTRQDNVSGRIPCDV